MAVDQVSVNGNLIDFGSFTCLVDGDPLNGIKAINYSDKRERTKGYGASKARTPRGRTRGKYSAEGSITLFKDSADALRKKLAAKSSGSHGSTVFNMQIQYSEDGTEFIVDDLIKVCLAGNGAKVEEGTDPLTEEIPLDIMFIKWNETTLFDASGGGIAGLS